ncbi:hypothetical protein VKT23_005952 [Stygiomarasmius scandens]|uniref:Uncharacterized protein n=1 Tax=Marasmiellus scandens TaxID=2682957 RepID=A0ABR1JTJ1_9AGAR
MLSFLPDVLFNVFSSILLMNMPSYTFLFLNLFSFSPPQNSVPLPSEIIFIAPPRDFLLPYNTSVTVGKKDPTYIDPKTGRVETRSYVGVVGIFEIGYVSPDGNSGRLLRTWGDEEDFCYIGGNEIEGRFYADQPGYWTLRWNLTYGTSSDPSQVNNTYCGPKPFTYQTWTWETYFPVLSSDDGATASETKTMVLDPPPTGRAQIHFNGV